MFTVLHSSAGAGKTHTLVKHYLGHALRSTDAGAYRKVLALTFTTKAAGEMKERVLHYLEHMSKGGQGNAQIDDVMDHLVHTANCTREEVVRRAAASLAHMLHHWGEVAIGTIDSFTRRVVRPFARDLQLDHDLRMTTEEEYYRSLAVEALVAEAGVEPSLTGLLTEVCLQLLHEERTWDPERPLLELSSELGRESAMVPLQQLGGLQPRTVGELVKRLRQQERQFQEQVRTIGREGLQVMERYGLRAEDFYQGTRGVAGMLHKLAHFDDELPPANAYVKASLEEHKWTSGKADAAAKAAIVDIAPHLADLVLRVRALEPEFNHFLLRRAVARDLPTAYALHALDEGLAALKREDGVAFFSDLTRKVAEVVKLEPVSFIHERLGERYRHFLIDEFQDTSLMQWSALLPLIDNALGSGGSALLVGDAKQAIYRWRNGEVRLFTTFPKLFGRSDDPVEAMREKVLGDHFQKGMPLDRNYRSGRDIVEFNNDLFPPLADLLPADLRTVYAGHAQDVARDRSAYVLLQRLDKELTGEARTEAMLEHTLSSLHEALADGHAPGDVAVLVRSGSMGRAVAQHLIDHGHTVVSPDGLKLSGDPVIELMVDLLRFLHSGDATAAARVRQYQAMLSAPDHALQVDPFTRRLDLVSPTAELRQWLKEHGGPHLRTTLTALVSGLARAHGLAPAEDAQLLTLLDEVHAWTSQHGQDLGGFLQHWERSGGRRSVTPPEHGMAVQVMTIHKSKGLQFPVVIIPNANMSSSGNHDERFWVDPSAAVPELPVALVRDSKALRATGLPELLEEEGLRLLDSLNLLYVAFTRPEQRLYALVPASGADQVTTELLSFMEREGNAARLERGSRTGPWQTKVEGPGRPLVDVAGGNAWGDLMLRLEAPDAWDPNDPDPFRRTGNAIHEVLARTTHPCDLDSALHRAVNEGLLEADEARDIGALLARILADPTMQPWFGTHLQVRTEASIITADGKSHRPDRVVFDGNVVRVLDIKTGRPSDVHHTQVRGYMHLLASLGHDTVEGALLYLPGGELVTIDA